MIELAFGSEHKVKRGLCLYFVFVIKCIITSFKGSIISLGTKVCCPVSVHMEGPKGSRGLGQVESDGAASSCPGSGGRGAAGSRTPTLGPETHPQLTEPMTHPLGFGVATPEPWDHTLRGQIQLRFPVRGRRPGTDIVPGSVCPRRAHAQGSLPDVHSM